MEWKLLLFSIGMYLVIIMCGFAFIPKEPPLFGMGMIPGPLAILRTFGLPLLSSLGISISIYLKARTRRISNVLVFWVFSMIIWLAVGLSH